MEDEKEFFKEELKSKNDPIEQWPVNKLKKEAGNDSEMGQSQERDEIGIE